MIILHKDEYPALDCEAEVMVDLLEMAGMYVQWYREVDTYAVRLTDVSNHRDPTAEPQTWTTHAPIALNALKGAFHRWSERAN